MAPAPLMPLSAPSATSRRAGAVVRLHYEAYDAMALHQMRRVAEQAQEKWPMLQKIAVVHRKGTLEIGARSRGGGRIHAPPRRVLCRLSVYH